MLSAFLLSTVVIFVAELGDKSQLLAMTFAARYRARDVLLAITGATLVVHLASVGLGAAVGAVLSDHRDLLAILAGVSFLGFAAWTLHGDTLSDDEADKAEHSTGRAVLVVGVAFFLAELGDKTMLATIALASDDQGAGAWTGTWLGSTLGMVAADALAIILGAVLGHQLPERFVRYAASVAFAAFGVLLILEGVS